MDVMPLCQDNLSAFATMAKVLWPETKVEAELDNAARILQAEKEACFLACNETGCIGFIYLSIRNEYVEGATSSPVAYVEGLFVVQQFRRFGVGKRMLEAGENWARQKGCVQMASDTELENPLGIEFHQRAGFQEVGRLVCFVKDIP